MSTEEPGAPRRVPFAFLGIVGNVARHEIQISDGDGNDGTCRDRGRSASGGGRHAGLQRQVGRGRRRSTRVERERRGVGGHADRRGGGGDTCDVGDNGLCFEFDTKGGTNEKFCKDELSGTLNKVPACPKELRFATCRVATPAMSIYNLAEDGQGGWESAKHECDKHKGVLSPTPLKEILATWTKQDISKGPLTGYTMLAPPHTKFEDSGGVQGANQYAGYFMMTIWKEKFDVAAARKDAQGDKDFLAWIVNTDTKLVWKIKDGKETSYKFAAGVNVGGTDFRCEQEMTFETEELANANVEACLSLAKK